LANWLEPIAKASPVTLTADAARALALTGGVPDSLGGSPDDDSRSAWL